MIRTILLCACLASLATGEGAPALDAKALSATSPLIAALNPPEGEWRKETVTAPDRAPEIAKLATAGEHFVAAVAASKDAPNMPAQHAIAALIKNLTSSEKPARPDALDPVFSRRTVRGGSLRRLGADAVAPEVEKAVAEACKMRAVAAYAGPQGARLEELRDAFGAGGWVLSGPRIAYAMPHASPLFMPMPDLILVVDLPAKADPAADAAKAVSAAVSANGPAIAHWDAKSDKLVSDLAVWRAAVPEMSSRGLAKGLFPPHLVLTSLDGDPLRLITGDGSLLPPRNGTPIESDRFLADVAKFLPDTAHLDLFGQYIFRYVYDSPDPRFPMLIGTSEFKGDIHQTAAMILGATTCGQCRGDCDDLAEMYQVISDKQGRFGHLILLPSHTAFAAARKDGTDWVVEVMQTGPTLAFAAPDVRDALRAAHAYFDSTAPFSPDQIGLLLRFSGENTRGPFQLGWRIFSERDYAKTMIDVQRDWQYQTYARAISKMNKLIAAGDKDPANLTELGGLYSATGQWELAAKEIREVLPTLSDPVSRIQEQMRLASILRRMDKADEAKTVLTETAALLKESGPKLGDGIAKLGMAVSSAMLSAGDREGARKVLTTTAFGPLAGLTVKLAQVVSQPGFDRRSWTGDGNLAGIRGLLHMYVGCLIAHLEKAGPDAAKDPTLQNARQIVDLWLAKLAFLDAEEPDDAISIYATAARIHALDVTAEGLATAVAAAKPPTDAKHDHLERVLGPAAQSREADLPWIRICPGWWMSEVNRAMRGAQDEDEGDYVGAKLDAAKADRARMAAAAKGAVEARAACAAMGMFDEQIDYGEQFAILTAAIANANDKALRERLGVIKKKNDKRWRDATAYTIGSLAPLCSEAQWTAVLKAWADEVDYKPKWFSIAWQAAIAGAPKQALATARMAASRFKDDPTFTEEAAFMQKLLGEAPKTDKADKPDKGGKSGKPAK